ncbi:CRTAC1 family protein [Alteromonadaceae bacterium M269]|nr:CRTAC1 family protein [Alteromonadaceae bacterium M269]
MNNSLKNYLIVFPCITFLAACGGGGSSEAPAPPAPPEPTSTPATPTSAQSPALSFSNSTSSSGLNAEHGYTDSGVLTMPMMFSGGVTSGDYDNDGDLDLYFVAGDAGTNYLYQNQGDGTFLDLASEAGVALTGVKSTGPVFADIDGDGLLDLFVGAVEGDPVSLFRNNGDGTFEDVTQQSGLSLNAPNTISATLADLDNDSDLDLLLTHWGHSLLTIQSTEIVWRNNSANGQISFVDVSEDWGINSAYEQEIEEAVAAGFGNDSSFVASTTDMDSDGDIDVLLVSDFGNTKVLRNDGNMFTDVTSEDITDQFGMGSALADYDNDGDIDWFVTSIHDKGDDNSDTGPIKNSAIGFNGNRIYNNDGSGNFVDMGTIGALNVADGGWGWGACFADFNNDGRDDIFHVNGWGQDGRDFTQYLDDRSRLFMQQADGSFVESAIDLGIDDARQGRGLVCNDIDGDGDIDLVTSNNQGRAQLFENQLGEGHHYLTIRLENASSNTQALGARIQVQTSDGVTQLKETRINNNFVSTNAVEAHFGFGLADTPVNVRVTWPDGSESEFNNIEVDQMVTLTKQD